MVFCIFMILVVMFSRNYLGVHTPQDVIAGFAGAIAAAFIVDRVLMTVDKKPGLDVWVLVGTLVLCLLGYLYVSNKQYPIDIVDGKVLVDPAKMTINSFKDPGSFLGFVVGWFLERRFINFNTDGEPMEKVMRCLVGGFLYTFVQMTFIIPLAGYFGSGMGYLLLFALNNIVFMTVYPVLALKFEAWARARRAAKAAEKSV